MSRTTTDHLFEKHYYSQPNFVDGSSHFHQLCRRHIERGAEILEIGAGASNPTSDLLADIGSVTGLDVSEEVLQNRSLARAQVFKGGAFPLPDASFDACISNYVLEHVGDPSTHFSEVARVLKTRGTYCLRTPNLWHYVTLASRMLPHRAHLALANRLRGLENGHNPYPTFYRANSLCAVRTLARSAGLSIEVFSMIEAEPWYGRWHAALFYPMMWYERLVNSSEMLEALRANILAVLRKDCN